MCKQFVVNIIVAGLKLSCLSKLQSHLTSASQLYKVNQVLIKFWLYLIE